MGGLAETCSEAAALWHELGDFARESDSFLALAVGLVAAVPWSGLQADCGCSAEAGQAARP